MINQLLLLIAPCCEITKLTFSTCIFSTILPIKPAKHKMEDAVDKLVIADDELGNIQQASIAEQKEYQ